MFFFEICCVHEQHRLMYWVIHAIITAYESYVPINPIPFWAEVKAALYFSLLFDGPIQTTMVFNKVVKPYFEIRESAR